jgi:hypothetical protein
LYTAHYDDYDDFSDLFILSFSANGMTPGVAAGIVAAAGGSRGPGFAALRRLRNEDPAKVMQNRPPATVL